MMTPLPRMRSHPPIIAARFKQRGFSLVELLVVIAIIAVLAGMTVGSMGVVTRATALTATAGNVIDQLNLARGQALTLNTPVEVRLYKLPDPDFPNDATLKAYRGLQVFQIKQDGTLGAPLGKSVTFGPGVVLAEDTSVSSGMDTALFSESTATGSDRKIGDAGTNYSYRSFRFNPDGEVTRFNGTKISQNPYFLMYLKRDFPGNASPTSADVTTKKLKNWFTVQIDSTNGRTRSFRP